MGREGSLVLVSLPKLCPPNSTQCQPPTCAGEQGALGVA